MSYYTGTAASIEALHTAIVNTCVSEGWTWDSGANILHKGTMFFNLSYGYVDVYPSLRVEGRTALSGGDIPQNYAEIRAWDNFIFQFPIVYHIFSFDKEVWLVIQHQPARYMHLCFGQSQLPLPGTGNFFAATWGKTSNTTGPMGAYVGRITKPVLFSESSFSGLSGVPPNNYASANSYYVHSGLHVSGNGWGVSDTTQSIGSGTVVGGINAVSGIINNQPNNYSQESVLVPIRAYHTFLSSKYGLTLELENARYVRNDYYEDEEIIELGQDRWMIFPFATKNIAGRDLNSITTGSLNSGTYAVAVKYEPVE